MRSNKRYVLTIIGTVLCLSVMMILNHTSYYTSVMAKIQNVGMGTLNEAKAKIENYLLKDVEVVQTTAISLEYMLKNNVSTEEMESFLMYESKRYNEEIDSNFKGIYGYVNKKHVDGFGWVPDEDFIPTQRVWYIAAKEAQGKTVIVPPYLDAKTNIMMMSISKMLQDMDSVIGVDIALTEIQTYIEEAALNVFGYTFLVDESGQIIAHSDVSKIGKNYLEDAQMAGILNTVFSGEKSYFEVEISDKNYQVCAGEVMGNWHVVMILDTDIFFQEVRAAFVRNILLCGVISVLIVFFYVYSFRRIQYFMALEWQSNEKVEKTNMKLIRALVRTIDAKDRYTNGHSVRVAEYAKNIAKRMGKSEEEQKLIYYAGLLHDVGKIRVPVEIINKPGKLTDEEFAKIKIHPVTGYHILKDIFDDKIIALGVKYHHERYDGKGYPSGLTGENIPEIARILGIADTYDAMTSNRSYRDALPQEKVREEIQRGKGTQFDSEIADIMLEMIDEDQKYCLRESDSEQKVVLVVDDDLMNLRIIELVMKEESKCRIVCASGAREALRLLEEIAVQLIILDVEMPEMDGFETLQKIREKYDIPVIFMSGDKDIATIQRTIDLGVVDYICKPFTALELKEILHNMLNEQSDDMGGAGVIREMLSTNMDK